MGRINGSRKMASNRTSRKTITMKHRTMKKTLSWYLIHLFMVTGIALFVTHDFSISASIASLELVSETFLFYAHEKVWSRFK